MNIFARLIAIKISHTTHATLDIVTFSLDNVNHNLFTRLVFLDLQKAFDTFSHNILLTKQEHHGIRGTANLINRKQSTFIVDYKSKVEPITCVVAQGSSLGSLAIFVIYK